MAGSWQATFVLRVFKRALAVLLSSSNESRKLRAWSPPVKGFGYDW